MSIRTGYSCPLCKKQTGETNEVIAESRRLVCSKVAAHTWDGPDEFYDLSPKIEFAMEQERPAPQPNFTSVNVGLPVATYNILLNRYGDKLAATLTAALNVLAEGETMVVSETDLERLRTVLNERPKNSGHLFGLVFAMQQQVQEAKQVAQTASEEIKAYENMSPGRVLVDLGENYNYALDRAKTDGLPVKVWVERNVKNALSNTWF